VEMVSNHLDRLRGKLEDVRCYLDDNINCIGPKATVSYDTLRTSVLLLFFWGVLPKRIS
jgi:hypothetical protein